MTPSDQCISEYLGKTPRKVFLWKWNLKPYGITNPFLYPLLSLESYLISGYALNQVTILTRSRGQKEITIQLRTISARLRNYHFWRVTLLALLLEKWIFGTEVGPINVFFENAIINKSAINKVYRCKNSNFKANPILLNKYTSFVIINNHHNIF